MSHNKIYGIIFAACMLLCGCQGKDSTEHNGPKEVSLDLSQAKLVSTDIGRLISLETNDSSLIYDICAMVPTANNLIVQSRKFIKVFDKETGKFIKQISKAGDGPGEYLSIQHFWAENDTLHLLDFNLGCILDYTADGEFLGKSLDFKDITAEHFRTPTYAVNSPDKTNYYVINCYAGNSAKANPQYSIVSKGGEFIQHVPGRELYDGGFTPDRMYTDFEHNRVLAWEQLRDTLFTVDANGVTPLYTFNFGKNRFPLESQSNPEFYKRVEDFASNESSTPYASLIKYYQCKGDNLFFSFATADNEKHNECYLGILNEKDEETRIYKIASNDGRYQHQPFFNINGDKIYIAMTDKINVESNPLVLEVPIASFLK